MLKSAVVRASRSPGASEYCGMRAATFTETRIGDLGFDVGDGRACDLRVAEFQLRNGFAAQACQVRSEVRLRRQALDDMATGATLFRE